MVTTNPNAPRPVTGVVTATVTTNDAAALPGAVGGTVAAALSGVLGVASNPGSLMAAAAAQAGQSAATLPTVVKPSLAAPNASLAKLDQKESAALLSLLGGVEQITGDIQAEMEKLGAMGAQETIKTLGGDIRSDQNRSKKLSDDRLKQIQESYQKAKEAQDAEGGFWSKLFKGLGRVFSAVTSVLTFAIGAALTATGAGSPLGVFLMGYGAMGVASAVMDVIDDIRTAMGKEPIGWRPSFGSIVSWALEKAGVPKETAMWIGVGVEVAAAGIAFFATPATAIAQAFKTGSKAANLVKNIQTTTTAGGAVTTTGKAVVNMQVASLKKEAAMADARAEELKAAVARVLKQIAESTDMIKELAQTVQERFQGASDAVRNTRDVGMGAAAAMRVSA